MGMVSRASMFIVAIITTASFAIPVPGLQPSNTSVHDVTHVAQKLSGTANVFQRRELLTSVPDYMETLAPIPDEAAVQFRGTPVPLSRRTVAFDDYQERALSGITSIKVWHRFGSGTLHGGKVNGIEVTYDGGTTISHGNTGFGLEGVFYITSSEALASITICGHGQYGYEND